MISQRIHLVPKASHRMIPFQGAAENSFSICSLSVFVKAFGANAFGSWSAPLWLLVFLLLYHSASLTALHLTSSNCSIASSLQIQFSVTWWEWLIAFSWFHVGSVSNFSLSFSSSCSSKKSCSTIRKHPVYVMLDAQLDFLFHSESAKLTCPCYLAVNDASVSQVLRNANNNVFLFIATD